MSIRTDHSFHIGEQHLKNGKPAQDYALSGMLSNDTAYAVVADGCSSGGMTDIGARLMVLATKRALEEYAHNADFPTSDAHVSAVNTLRDSYLEAYRVALGLTHRDLLATCLWAVAGPQTAFYHVTGDGVILLRYQNNGRMETYEWAQNMPYYPAYHLGSLAQQYKESQAQDSTPFSRTITGSHGDGIDVQLTDSFTVDEGMRGINVWLEREGAGGSLTDIVLFSDGVEQIDRIDTFDSATALTNWKSTSGKFVVRRMNRFLQESKKVGRGPIDDIAMAVIHLEPQASA